MEIYEKLNILDDILMQNQSLTELVQGYCLSKADLLDEMNSLLIIIDIILRNQEDLRNNKNFNQ